MLIFDTRFRRKGTNRSMHGEQKCDFAGANTNTPWYAEKMYLCPDKQSGMNQRFTYSIPPHALSFPATASHICVSEPRPTSLNHPVQPLKGLRDPRAASVSYRAFAPVGAGTGHRVCAGTSDRGNQKEDLFKLLVK